MKNIARSFLVAAAATVSLSAQSLITGPSSSQTPYLTPTAPGWSSTSILTVGDAIGGYQMVGIPDGLGAFSNGDGTMTVLANHELGNTSGTVRGHGAIGAFVSKWVINTSTWQVISGGDLVTSAANQMMWNGTTWAQPSTPYAIARLCSADLPKAPAFWDASTSYGYDGRIFMNGEETGVEGKAFAWIVTGTDAGKMYELPHLGKNSWENALARSSYGVSPGAANLLQTAVALTDDSTPGEVYLYLGTKTNTGNAVQKAGLTNGQVYGIKVNAATGYTGAVVYEAATGINGTFLLAPIFTNSTIAAKTGAEFQAAATTAGTTQFARPEDGHWLDHDSLLFATTGATVNSISVTSKIYQLDFNSDATNGLLTTGGNISVVVNSANMTGLDGAKATTFDNLTVGEDGKLYIQEDPGNNAYVAKHWVVDLSQSTQALRESTAVQIFESDRSRFTTGATQFQTIDEEHSGIIDITSIVNDGITGSKWLLVATQNHAAATGASAATLVEGGQFIALNYKVGTNSGLVGNLLTLDNGGAIVANGAAIAYNVALTGTGGVFNTTANTSVSGAIGGTGGLWKNGTGTLTLTGVNTYTGNTNVEVGKLVVNGSLSSAVRILKNGSFGGNANIVGNLTNLGTLAPGNSPGTINITGNYLEAGTLDIEVWGLTAGTQHDQVIASGTATFQTGSNLKVTKTGGTFDLGRTESVLAVSAGAYSGSFTTLDRSTQTTQVFFNNATGRIHGSGLTEAQTFADLTADSNRKAIATALYADGLTNATVLRASAGGSATAKAFLATGEMGATTVAFLGSANVDTALDALSPEVYGTSMIMASRNSLTLARALTGAIATPEGWNMQVGYDQQQATLSASPTTLNGNYDVNATYVIATKALSTSTQFAVLISQNDGTTSASGFSSKGSGQSLGFGFAADLGATRLDLALTGGKLKNSGTRNGQAFANQNLEGSSMLARLSFSKLGAFTPYVGLNRSSAKFDAFTETGTGANLNVSAATQTNTNAEVGLGYAMKLTDTVSISLNVAYEHNLNSTGNSLTASFADAAAPTSFNVATYGAGQNVLRGGIGFEASLGAGRSAGLSYDMHSGVDMKSAHEVKVNYTFRF
ncbi:MAG: autotransporter domain-containing protein [Verrucomicrobia bacterium]|nr:autotransporter domain-containing protein [Verrucomicrobiota bacterium]